MMSDGEDFDCPLCMEELDISDRNFRPCPCGYQICRFCWHHIKEDLNGRCPACRRVYSEETVEFIPISADELAMIKNEKKAKEREKKEIEAMNRKHLANMRVVQKSLVYVIGLPTKLANDEHALRQQEYFGQYGKISKVVVNRRNSPMPMPGAVPGQPSLGVYITYVRKEDAAKAIAAIDGSIWDGKILRASYGTTKYCSYYLRGMSCQNPGCMYLHEPGEDADSFSKEDLAVSGKHNLQDSMVPYDPYIHKPSALGRPALLTHSSSSSLTPRTKSATVAPTHSSAASSLVDWPVPGERSGMEDRDDEGSALPATASWAKVGSNPSTPTLINSLPLSRKLTEPPPLRAKGSTTSIITGVVVNNANKDTNDSPALDYAPTPAEALAIEAAAKQQLLQEQRQQQEQQRKLMKQQLKQQEETEQQAEVLNRKLRKQRQQEEEREQQELQKQKQQQEMEQKMQAQLEKEKEQKRKERLQAEKEAQEKEKEEQERQAAEAKEKQERELLELEEQRRKAQVENLFVTAPTLSLGSFTFNPDASLSTQPLTLGSGMMQLGRDTPGSFGLDSFSAFSNLPVTPGHYTGSFNPFSMDDEPLMRRSAIPAGPTRSFLDESEFDAAGRQRPMGPPIPGKPRQTSRFGFAMDNQFGDSYGFDSYSDPIMSPSMQEGFRALFPNVNVSFGAANGSLNAQQQQHQLQQQQQQQQQQHLRQLHQQQQQQLQLQQQQQQQQQQTFQTLPLLHRQGSTPNGMWNAGDKQDSHTLQRNMAQLSMDNMQSTPSSRMAEYHQQMRNHSQRNGPPGITRNTLNPSMIKSPPPGLESLARSDMGNWSGSQQQQQQQQQASSRMNGWSNDNGPYNSLAFQDPAIMSARLPSSGATKASLMEALQNPMPSNGLNGYRMANSHDSMDSNHSSNSNDAISEGDKKQDGQQQQVASLKQQQQKQGMPDSPSSLQNFPLGSKRKEIKSVKGVLNSGMNAPLNGGSRSRPSSTPGSPLVEPRLQLSTQQQQQQQQQLNSQAMNGLTSAAARSAKVKSDLLMGLNSSSIRSDRHSAAVNMKDGSDGSQYDTNGYGQQHSPMMGSAVTGPPPGLSMPNGNSNNNTNHNNSGSPYSMSNLLGRQPESSQSLYGNTNGKPLDVATMMSALDLFGPGQASSLMMSPNWSLASGHSQQQQQQQQQKQQQQHQQQDKNSGSNTSQSSPSLASAASGGATARSVEDLELQVINAKMETQMLENQLNAVIKRNRRKLYA